MVRRAIVNVALGAWYPIGQQRLFDSLEERSEGATRLFWRDCYPPGCPTHDDAPYAFKPYAFARARELGFDQAVWLDASVWLHKRPLDDLWARIDEDGWYLEPDGHRAGEWINDRALTMLGVDRDEAMDVILVEGKMLGLDLHDPTAQRFLDEWLRLADAGAFAGAWTNDTGSESSDPRCRGHRHDIAVASLLIDSFGMGMQQEKRLGFPADGAPGDRILAMAQGM